MNIAKRKSEDVDLTLPIRKHFWSSVTLLLIIVLAAISSRS